MENIKSTCCKKVHTPSKLASGSKGFISFISTLLLILLPKCPFCVIAYTGAILMFFDIDNSQLAPFLLHAKPILGTIVVLMILLNNRGRKTFIATIISGTALVLLILSAYLNIQIIPEWALYTSFVFAIWYNGNFEYFFRYLGLRKQ
ncbi:hypothetical protein [Eudoraea sp.]|uniref:hypothetical protein n=1 Tax=Eudoraea sp. TaxID=1979955 RepID=UPI003C73C3F6